MSHIPSYNSSIQLSINGVNFSMQAGDFIYFISGFSLGGFDYQDESNIRFLGENNTYWCCWKCKCCYSDL
jgi:hypothetical protein